MVNWPSIRMLERRVDLTANTPGMVSSGVVSPSCSVVVGVKISGGIVGAKVSGGFLDEKSGGIVEAVMTVSGGHVVPVH